MKILRTQQAGEDMSTQSKLSMPFTTARTAIMKLSGVKAGELTCCFPELEHEK